MALAAQARAAALLFPQVDHDSRTSAELLAMTAEGLLAE
jgi:hypothetical protein